MVPVGSEDRAIVAGRWFVHEFPAIEINPANVVIADPYVNVGWLETVFSCVHHKPELPLYRDSWHPIYLRTDCLRFTWNPMILCIINDTSVKAIKKKLVPDAELHWMLNELPGGDLKTRCGERIWFGWAFSCPNSIKSAGHPL